MYRFFEVACNGQTTNTGYYFVSFFFGRRTVQRWIWWWLEPEGLQWTGKWGSFSSLHLECGGVVEISPFVNKDDKTGPTQLKGSRQSKRIREEDMGRRKRS
ncbi:hypothetical protein MLD38_007231 [Melastoma candidum]|uniref:Uncharacterized protein n=1 Tax=Melastoma candidum TaxID=119954 RepID=A0ACB9RUP7_9MYRT|nr:hypothetical protein MLD38_007231 [Melastoma candidum]